MTDKLLTLFRFLALCAIGSIANVQPSFAEGQAEEPLVVFAAASLADVLETHAEKWSAATGRPLPRLSFGPSGTMARQIAAGAPSDLYISANSRWVAFLEAKKMLRSAPIALAGNSLVLVVPGRHAAGSLATLDAVLLSATIGDGRLAIADPAVAPAGDYAKEFLIQIGLWDSLEARLAFGGSARQTLLLAERGNIPALVYSTDARMSRRVTAIAAAPAGDIPPIRYRAALIRLSSPLAQEFLDYLTSKTAAADWLGFGFSLAPENASN